jgi:ferredoxin
MPSATITRTLTITLELESLHGTRHFHADATQTILQACEAAHIYPPSSCRNGTCRTCISTLISGEIRYHLEWPGLSAEEKQAGLILPCCAYPLSDLMIRFKS